MSEPVHTRTAASERTRSKAVGSVRLLVVDGPDRGVEAIVHEGTAVIGVRDDCELVLHDPTVSRRHASIELLGTRVRVRDLQSKNGTKYLGARIESVEVPVGSTVEIGASHVALLPSLGSTDTLSERTELAGLHGQSPVMRRLFAAVERVAPSDAPVLIHGETGSGKEGVARGIHQLSGRAKGPWVVFDCAAIHRELAQSALFGHRKGSFTGATSDAEGVLEQADGGTLFLDEIGELPIELQPALLRALETRTFTRVGENDVRSADFRIVAATHRDLQAQAREGAFRSDLYFRLAAIVLDLPSLRQRREDIPLLAELFASRAAREPVRLQASTIACLTAYEWPGNVRELRNTVERLVALGPDASVPWPSSNEAEGPRDFHQSREIALKAFEKSYLTTILDRNDGSASAAAREAGIARSYFYRLLEEHGLKGSAVRKPKG